MSTISVTYKFSTFKCKVGPSTVLNDVLVQSLMHFKLSTDANSWSLEHQGKYLSLTLPLRLLNLPAGVKVVLKANDKASNVGNTIRVKFQVVGADFKIVTVKTTDQVASVIDDLCKKNGWEVSKKDIKLQVFTRVLKYEELKENTFSDLGMNEDVSARLTLPINQQSLKLDVEQPEEGKEVQQDRVNTVFEEPVKKASKDSQPSAVHEIHKVSAYVPSSKSSTSDIQEDESVFELTISHARKYQEMLSKNAGSSAMLTRRLREQQEQKNKRNKITRCDVRVRFPDRTNIEISFNPDETISNVYQLVAQSLIDETLTFTLHITHPYQLIEPSDKQLDKDLGFGSKTLLVLESPAAGPYLKNALMHSAKDIMEAEDVRLDRREAEAEEVEDNSRKNLEKNHTAYTGESNIAKEFKTTTKKVPKWLKLTKK